MCPISECGVLSCRYAIVWEKGYQETDTVTSAALTKLKGVQYVNISGVHVPGVTDRVWDVADYVVPPQVCRMVFNLHMNLNL